MKPFKIIYYIIVGLISLIAVLLVVSVFPITGNYEVKIVLSGSMEPAIRIGSVSVIKPLENYDVGDIITFGRDTKTDIPTTHRIIKSRVVEGRMLYTTKGDTNDSPDVREVRENEIIGKVMFSIPFLGYVLDFAKKPIGFAFIIIIPTAIIIFSEVEKIYREIKKRKKKGE